MSETLMALLIILPVALVIFFLNRSQKMRQRKKEAGYLEYLHSIKDQAGIDVTFKKQLLSQLVAIDEPRRSLLVIDACPEGYRHTLFDLKALKSYNVKHVKETVMLDEKRTETFTSQMGLELLPVELGRPAKLIVFFDRVEHNVITLPIFEKEAMSLKEKIKSLVG